VKFEIGVVQKVNDVALASRVQIVDAEYVMPLFEQPFAKVGAQEPGSSSHRATFTKMHESSFRLGH
jgi:hypothetical protein